MTGSDLERLGLFSSESSVTGSNSSKYSLSIVFKSGFGSTSFLTSSLKSSERSIVFTISPS